MILMVAGAAAKGWDSADFVSPARRQWIGSTPIWAADNGCFGSFDPDQFRRMLDKIASHPNKPVFVTVPDVVGCHIGTGDRWVKWCHEFDGRNLPQAYVLQNGIEQHPPAMALPWTRVRAIFIGGSTDFKFTPWVRACVRFAKKHGRWVHMGRVNSVTRMLYARDIGCDSCDGSGVSRFPDAHLPRMNSALRQLELLNVHQQ